VTLKTWLFGWHQPKWQRTIQEHRYIFQQLNNHFQAHLTRKSKLVVFRNIYCFSENNFSMGLGGTHGDSCHQNGKIRSTLQPRLKLWATRINTVCLIGKSPHGTQLQSLPANQKNGIESQIFYNNTAFVSHVRNPLPSWP